MKEPGLTRADMVFLNRIWTDYLQDELPNQERVRHDAHLLVNLAHKLDDQIARMLRTRREA